MRSLRMQHHPRRRRVCLAQIFISLRLSCVSAIQLWQCGHKSRRNFLRSCPFLSHMSSIYLVSPHVVAFLVTLLAHVSCSSEPLPSISIPRCNTDSPAILKELFRSNSSTPFPARTSISLCWTPDNLLLEYDSQDDFTLRNDFLECNSPMYSQVSAHYFILLCAFLLCSGC